MNQPSPWGAGGGRGSFEVESPAAADPGLREVTILLLSREELKGGRWRDELPGRVPFDLGKPVIRRALASVPGDRERRVALLVGRPEALLRKGSARRLATMVATLLPGPRRGRWATLLRCPQLLPLLYPRLWSAAALSRLALLVCLALLLGVSAATAASPGGLEAPPRYAAAPRESLLPQESLRPADLPALEELSTLLFEMSAGAHGVAVRSIRGSRDTLQVTFDLFGESSLIEDLRTALPTIRIEGVEHHSLGEAKATYTVTLEL